MADEYTEAAVAAAVAVARRCGLPADAPDVLHDRSNVLVRLGPVVARVPATTRLARPDPAAWLARDVALSAYLTERDVLVVSPTTDPPAGPHFAHGLPVTLWHHVRPDADRRCSPAELVESLGRVHAALRGYTGGLPERGPLDELHRILDRHGATMDGAAPRLRAEADRIAAAMPVAPLQALHGDAHPSNVMVTSAGPCWLDFEDTWRGPLAWDLATFAKETGRDALAAYPGEVGEAAFAPCLELRRLFEVPWRYVIARRFPHRLPEARAALARYFA
ncbi:phosphotransferase family protein [Amycolatopsis sp. NPDC059027]|uniref:phosphotransferase family protein n=1 Tax=Amycolatopsis sp. NPDC059027 TaxID=3346709 RepID=UPI00366AC20D